MPDGEFSIEKPPWQTHTTRLMKPPSKPQSAFKFPLSLIIVPIMLLMGPILLGIVFIFFALFNMTHDNKIAASDLNPVHQGPSEFLFYLFLFIGMITLSLLAGALVWLFQKKPSDPGPQNQSCK